MSADPAERLYFLEAARSPEQRRYMEGLERDGICIFCEEHVEQHQAEPVEHRGEHWLVTKNSYPYRGAAAHYLIVARRHVRSFDELPDEAGAELWSIKRALKRQLDPIATATVERSGDMRFNGGSVAHLHVHFVALDESPEATVRFKVSAEGAQGGG
jgi:diadenosine tetraphosphate (Ap4A) HIT family hydrolase